MTSVSRVGTVEPDAGGATVAGGREQCLQKAPARPAPPTGRLDVHPLDLGGVAADSRQATDPADVLAIERHEDAATG